ncbi:integral membrane sensor signal transduction histidine kinase [Calothrix sp. NIES-4071]|nr:integral membrane sensor signal transduction histidine kinase [Calothrix sp. NIES-4071]BAZ63017.1 integral membrane sensor signal transduction histidine kinase [Calothrix sp. NIES-4105]
MKSFYTELLKRFEIGANSSDSAKKVSKIVSKITKTSRKWHGTLVIAPGVTGLIIGIRLLGWLQPLELAALDIRFRLRPAEPVDTRFVIIGIEESDITRFQQWPFADKDLARLINKIKEQQPRIIGLDLYRNLPVEPGHAELLEIYKTTPNLYGIQKIVENGFNSKIDPPPILGDKGQTGSNDITVDIDGVIRRGVLFPEPGNPLPSLGLVLAAAYLEKEGIKPETAPDGSIKFKNTIFHPFEANDGSYINADAGGYQIIMNYRGQAKSFSYVSLMDVLEGRISGDLMRDRIVLIGAKAQSLNDAFYTPYSRGFSSTPERTPGVEIQATLASQVLSSVLDGRPSIYTWHDSLEYLWIFLWVLLIATLGWKWRNTKALSYLIRINTLLLSSIISIGIISYIIFLFGWWIPVLSPMLALIASTIGISSYVYITRLRELNSELEKTVKNLEEAMSELQQSQLQLIQSEKMSTLGQLVAGVAHEINNPVGFISGNLKCLEGYVQDLVNHIQLYHQHFPEPGEEIEEDAETIDVEYILEDMPKMVASMQVGVTRIKEISISLRTFSRSDTASKVPYNIHEGIDSTILILKHRLKGNSFRPEIQIIKEYGELPMVNCYPGQLNQVIMNLIANAIDALDDSNEGKTFTEVEANPNKIVISTSVLTTQAIIKIKDNGLGMSDEVKQKVFEHLFTTKGVGKGTGLGLSISRQIVEETHGGTLTCFSEPGNGAEFIIEIPI